MATAAVKARHDVIVFGASGFIGSNIFRNLKQKKDLDVVGYSSKSCDLLNQSQVTEVLALSRLNTTVILCSAIIPRSIEDCWDTMLKNIHMVHNLVSSIPDAGLRSIIFLSSVDIYGNVLSKKPITEDTLPKPRGFYALSKLSSEHIFRINKRCNYPVAHLRLPGIYGYGDGYRSVIGKFIRKILSHEQIEIIGDGTVKRDYVEVGDLCRVVEHLVRRPYDGPLNIATGKSTSIKDIVSVVADVIGVKASIKWLDEMNNAGFSLIFDTKRLELLCPTIKLKDLKGGVNHYLGQINRYTDNILVNSGIENE